MKELKTHLFFLLLAATMLKPQISFTQIANVQFEQLDSLQMLEKKPVVVFFHTSWCKYCDIMKNTTLKNVEVIKLLQQNFYFVNFDIETKDDIFFREHFFKYRPTGIRTGVHDLAKELGTINGEIAYPGICILNNKNEIVFQHEGYLSANAFLSILDQIKEYSRK